MASKPKSVDWLDVAVRLGAQALREALVSAERVPERPEPATKPEKLGAGVKRSGGEAGDDGGKPGGGPNLAQLPEGGRVFPAGDAARARMYLAERLIPGEDEMADPRQRMFRVVALTGEASGRIGGGSLMLRWDGATWTPLADEELRHVVRSWVECEPFYEPRTVRGEEVWRRKHLSLHECNAIVHAIRDEVSVNARSEDGMIADRFWVVADLDEDLQPIFGRPGWTRVLDERRRRMQQLPDPSRVLALQNLCVDLDQWDAGALGVFRPAPRLIMRDRVPVALDEATMREREIDELADELAPEWMHFLFDTFQTMGPIVELQKWFGYSLGGETHHQFGNILCVHGPSGSGKGLIVAVLAAMLGRLAMPTSISRLDDAAHVFEWPRRHVVYFEETRVGFRDNDAAKLDLLLTVSGGGRLTVRGLYRDEEERRCRTRILMSCSSMPDFNKAGDLRRRMLLLDIQRTPERVNERLEATLTSERSLRGVLLWALMGRRRLVADGGFTQPAESEVTLSAFFADASPLDEFAERGEKGVTPVSGWLYITNDEADAIERADLGLALKAYLMSKGIERLPRPSSLIKQALPVLRAKGWATSGRSQAVVRDDEGHVARRDVLRGLRLSHDAEAAVRGLRRGEEGEYGGTLA